MGLGSSKSKAKKQVNPAPCTEEAPPLHTLASTSKASSVALEVKPKVLSVSDYDPRRQDEKTAVAEISSQRVLCDTGKDMHDIPSCPNGQQGTSDDITMPNVVDIDKDLPTDLPDVPKQSSEISQDRQDTGKSSVLVVATSSQEERRSVEDQTPTLLAAVENDDWAAVESLLQGSREYDPNARTTDWGYSLLRAAAEEGAVEVCRLLIAHRADVNARDPNGMTPLMGCVTGGDVGDIVSLLLEAKADATLTTDDNFTALKWATRLNREESISLLRAAGLEGELSCF